MLCALVSVALLSRSGNFNFYRKNLDRINATAAKELQAAIKAEEQSPAVFQKIYAKGLWGTMDGPGAGSGYGSVPQVAAGASRIIYHVVMMYGARRVIDAPCGGMAWQHTLVAQLHRQVPEFEFLGIDVVPEVVARNRRIFRNDRHISFAVGDVRAPQPLARRPRRQRSTR